MASHDPCASTQPTTHRSCPRCCKCNGSGVCKNCSCVKSGEMCTNCLPSRRNSCRNLSGNHNSQTDSNSEPSQVLVPIDHLNPSVAPAVPSTSTDGFGKFGCYPQLAPATELHSTTNILPAFVPMSDSQFMWGEL